MENKDKQQKKVVAVSRATYRGYPILETENGYMTVQLGTVWVSSRSLTALTLEIDKWIDLKKN